MFHADNIADLAVIAYHAWWPGYGDPFWQADSVENRQRINYYGVTGTPTFNLDGSVAGGWQGVLLSRLGISSPLTMDPAITYNPGTRTGSISVTITNESAAPVTGNYRLVVTESNIYWPAPNGTLYHNFTMRDMIPGSAGTPVSLAAGASTVVTQPFTIAPAWAEQNIQLIGFVQAANREVLQATRVFAPFDQPYLAFGDAAATPLAGGDGDAYLDAGESGQLVVTLENLNLGEAGGTTATLTTTDPYLTVIDGSGSFGTVPGFGSASNPGDPFVLSVAAGAPSGYTASFSLAISATSPPGYSRTVTGHIGLSAPTDYTGPAGVYYAYEDTDPYSESPVYSWTEIRTLGIKTVDQDDTSARFPIGFRFRYYGANYDTVTICSNGWIAPGQQLTSDNSPTEIPSTDGPQNMIAAMWDDLDPSPATGGGDVWRYYDSANHRYIVEFDAVRHFGTLNAESFQFVLLDPAYYPTSTGDGEVLIIYKDVTDPSSGVAGMENREQTIGIQYSYFGTPNPSAVGIADQRVIRFTPDAPARTGVPGRLVDPAGPAVLMAAAPNPFAQSTQIAFRVPARQPATLKVFAPDGRLVATLFDGIANAGVTSTGWNGRDAAGHELAPGLYFARLATSGASQVAKLMLIR